VTVVLAPEVGVRTPASGARTLLRWWGEPPADAEHDAAALAAAWAEPEVARWTAVPRLPQNRDRAAAARWIDGEPERRSRRLALDLVVGSPDDGGRTVLGEVGLTRFDERGRAELGFWLAPPARGRGLATEAVTAVTRWAHTDLGLTRVWARTEPANARAAMVLVRAGFVLRGEAGGSSVWTADAANLRA
jgi:RimJ/RimL family protein N-acetyltransferase